MKKKGEGEETGDEEQKGTDEGVEKKERGEKEGRKDRWEMGRGVQNKRMPGEINVMILFLETVAPAV